MIPIILAIALFGIGTYYNQLIETKKTQIKKNNINELNVFNKQQENKKETKKKSSKKILPRNFSHLLDNETKKKYQKRKHEDKNLPNNNPLKSLIDIKDEEILKYIPKKDVVKSNLTGEEFTVKDFITSNTITKDDNLETFDTTWAIPLNRKNTQPMQTESFQNKLELFTGNQQFNFHKKETTNFFKPSKDISFVDGSPVVTEKLSDRYVKSRTRQTELPFEQEKVGRGIGQNYGNRGKGGFHQFEINEIVRPKNVDELRTLNNPKVIYKPPVISGKGIAGRSATPNVKRYRPTKTFLNKPSRYLKTTGAYLKESSKPEFILKTPSRARSKALYGSASPATRINQMEIPEFRKSTRNNYKSTGARNTVEPNSWNSGSKNSDYGKGSFNLPPNERDITQKRTHFTNFASIFKSIIAPIQDKIKRTKKENIEGNPNIEGYMSVNKPNKPTVHDPNDIAKTTIKETNIHNKHNGNVNGPNKLTVHDPNDVARTTIKETNIHNKHNGNINGPNKITVHDPNDIARTTIKETNIHNKKNGILKGATKLAVYDPNDIAKTTIKETNIHNNREGNIDVERMKKPTSYNILPPKRTMKETTIDNVHHTNVSFNRGDGKGYLSSNYFAPATIKQFTSNRKYGGNIHSSVGNKGGHLSSKYYAPATMKQYTSNKAYSGGAGAYNKEPTSYRSSYNSRTNSNREKISKGRAPTNNGVKVVNGVETVNVVFKKQNAKIDYSNTQKVSLINQVISSSNQMGYNNQKVPLSNRGNVERTNPKTLNQLNENPYHISINRKINNEIEGFISEVSGSEQSDSDNDNDNDTDMENFISEISDISDAE